MRLLVGSTIDMARFYRRLSWRECDVLGSADEADQSEEEVMR